jgi:hypothetical protein
MGRELALLEGEVTKDSPGTDGQDGRHFAQSPFREEGALLLRETVAYLHASKRGLRYDPCRGRGRYCNLYRGMPVAMLTRASRESVPPARNGHRLAELYLDHSRPRVPSTTSSKSLRQ